MRRDIFSVTELYSRNADLLVRRLDIISLSVSTTVPAVVERLNYIKYDNKLILIAKVQNFSTIYFT